MLNSTLQVSRTHLLATQPSAAKPSASQSANTPALKGDTWQPTIQTSLLSNDRFRLAPTLETIATGERSLTLGQKDLGLKVVKQALLDMGFAIPGGLTTLLDQGTFAAIKSFQSSQNLPQTGKLDRATLLALDAAAPQPNLFAWSPGEPAIAPVKVGNKNARIVIDKSEHRLFFYKPNGTLERIMPVALAKDPIKNSASGIKMVSGFMADPRPLGKKYWNDETVFGTRLIDLSWYDPKTKKYSYSGEELHGTYNRAMMGQNPSHGCFRLYNENIEDLFSKVKFGDLVIVKE